MEEELNETLDQTVLEIFQVLEELYEKQAELEMVLKDGYFSMARARYNLGVKRITADQIVDAHLTANSTVEVNSDSGLDKDGEEVDDICESFQDLFIMYNENQFGGDKSDMSKLTEDFNKGSESGVRKRGKGVTTTSEEKTIEDKKFKLRNPINLFGVLVPQTLHSCQRSFEEAVQISVDIANRKYKLNMLQKKINHLKQKKSNSLSDDSFSKGANNTES